MKMLLSCLVSDTEMREVMVPVNIYFNSGLCFTLASIPTFTDFYAENDLNNHGIRCLQLLNEIIVEFDQVSYWIREIGLEFGRHL